LCSARPCRLFGRQHNRETQLLLFSSCQKAQQRRLQMHGPPLDTLGTSAAIRQLKERQLEIHKTPTPFLKHLGQLSEEEDDLLQASLHRLLAPLFNKQRRRHQQGLLFISIFTSR